MTMGGYGDRGRAAFGTARAIFLVALGATLASCGSCTSCAVRSLKVGGPHPYVRCNELDPPKGSWKVGRLAVTIEKRVLRIDAPGGAARMSAFRGPAPSRQPLGDVKALFQQVDVGWVLGDVGDDEPTAVATLRALAAAGPLFIVLGGGRDDAEVLRDAFAALSAEERTHAIDARGIRQVAIGAHRFELLSGGRGGRYGRTDRACGYGDEDLGGRWTERVEGKRYLVSWMSPAAPGYGGVSVGDEALAKAIGATGFAGVLSAWPALEAAPTRWIVPRLGGPPVDAVDGSRLSGALRLELTPSGLAGP